MLNPEILILDTNTLTQLTINSIKKNMPRAKYKVVKCGGSKIGTALAHCSKPTLVVSSGLVLNIRQGDLPGEDKLKDYDICVSRAGVYVDHPKLKGVYSLINSPINKGHIDLSIFIINPARWYEIPSTDKQILASKRTLYMPRYINHKNDVIIKDCVGSYEAFHYGMMGESASVYNYVPHLLSGKATPVETFAYCFDKIEDYVDGLSEHRKNKILKLAQKSKIRISKIRKGIADLKKGEQNV